MRKEALDCACLGVTLAFVNVGLAGAAIALLPASGPG
jgi:hypothetical protein